MKGILKVKDRNPEATVRALLGQWLSEGKLGAVLVPAYSKSGAATMALVSEPDKLGDAMPLMPSMAVNAASVVHDIAADGTLERKVGLVLRPCEARALVELIKLRQVVADNLVIIGMDCGGTYRSAGFRDVRGADTEFDNRHVREQEELAANPNLRTACKMCEFPRAPVADIAIGWLGMNVDEALWVEAATDKGKALAENIGLAEADEPAGRAAALKGLAEKRLAEAERRIAENDPKFTGAQKLAEYYADCLNCHNCMRVCPVCYCRECFFDSDTFKRDIGEHVRIAKRKGLTRMPSETLLFHLTRMNHMMASCVACGICEESCPVGIGLTVLFKKVSRNAQAEFEYVSGRSLDEPLPLTTFREDEFKAVGEAE